MLAVFLLIAQMTSKKVANISHMHKDKTAAVSSSEPGPETAETGTAIERRYPTLPGRARQRTQVGNICRCSRLINASDGNAITYPQLPMPRLTVCQTWIRANAVRQTEQDSLLLLQDATFEFCDRHLLGQIFVVTVELSIGNDDILGDKSAVAKC